jgi:hypothetical protein
MRKINGLALVLVVGALIPQPAHAATEVLRLPANNKFASAISNAPDGTTTGIFLSRHLTDSGGPIDSIFFIVSKPDGTFVEASATLPQGAFQIAAKSASLNVDLNAITLDMQVGEIPANGVITVQWAGTDVQRMSGSVRFDFDTTHVVLSGTRTDVVANVTATVFGTPLVEPFGSFSTITQSVIIVTRD